jgi:hypothetical protein
VGIKKFVSWNRHFASKWFVVADHRIAIVQALLGEGIEERDVRCENLEVTRGSPLAQRSMAARSIAMICSGE